MLLESEVKALLITAYTAGRSSMRQEILAVVPERKRTCGEEQCEHTLRMDRALLDLDNSFNACRSQLLTNIEGIE